MSNGEFGPARPQLAAEIHEEISADAPTVDASPESDGAADSGARLGDVVGPGNGPTDPTVVEPPGPLRLTSVTAGDGAVSAFFRLDAATDVDELATDAIDLEVDGHRRDVRVVGGATEADVVLVFDDAGGMYEEIVGAHAAIGAVVDRLSAAGVDARFALVTAKEDAELRQDFTADREAIVAAVEGVSGSLGDRRPAPGIESIGIAAGHAADADGRTLSPFRPGAHRVVVSVTDAPALVADGEGGQTVPESAADRRPVGDPDGLRRALREVTLVEVADRPVGHDGSPVAPFAPTAGGTFVERTVATPADFAALLTDDVADLVTETCVATADGGDSTATARPIRLTVDDPDAGPVSAAREGSP